MQISKSQTYMHATSQMQLPPVYLQNIQINSSQ